VSEVSRVDIFEREPVFIEEIMKPLVADIPGIKTIMEHISTEQAVGYILGTPENVKASSQPLPVITCSTIATVRFFSVNCVVSPHDTRSFTWVLVVDIDLLVGGVRPELYCSPIVMGKVHRQALVKATIRVRSRNAVG
jgi:dihydroorotase